MNLSFEKSLAASYLSPTQKIRVLTEHWVSREVFCPNCGCATISRYRNNQPVADFSCAECADEYELKSQKGRFGPKVVDGAYGTMMNRLNSQRNPNLFLLNYKLCEMKVVNFLVVPKHFFVSAIVQQRKPLSASARRAGWVGCNILLQLIPESGRIYLVRNGTQEPRSIVLAAWQRTLFLREQADSAAKGWLLDIMRCIDRLGQRSFTLKELYAFEDELKRAYPGNRHVREKIRQQLQVLRDKGYVDFLGRGAYRLANIPE